MDCNRETILDELNDFGKRSNEISPVLEDYLMKIAHTGDIMFPWVKLKPLLKRKLEIVLDDFYETCPTDNLPPLPNVEPFKYDVLKNKIAEALDFFHSAPFTIQRICELLTSPRKHYKRTDKFLRGLEKNILVVSTVEPKSRYDNEVNNNNASTMLNGLITVGTNDQQLGEKESSHPNVTSEMKTDNSTSQFDAFRVLSTTASTSVINSETPSTSQVDKTENNSADVNSNTSNLNDKNTDITDMDVGTYKETNFSNDNSCSQHSDLKKNTSTSNVSTSMNNSSHSSLENFSIFTAPSSVEDPDKSTIPDIEKCDENTLKLAINEHPNDRNNFQDTCDNHVPENAMDITPSTDADERKSYSGDEDNSDTSSHSSPSEHKVEYFNDICSSMQEQSSVVYSSIPESSNVGLNEQTTDDSCDGDSCIEEADTECSEENRDTPKFPSDINHSTSHNFLSKSTSADMPQSHSMQTDSEAICVETISTADSPKTNTEGLMPPQDIMDLETPSKTSLPDFIQGDSKVINSNLNEQMEED